MRTTGANHFHYGKVWSSIEPRPGVYNLDDVRARVADSSPLPIAFNLRVIDAGSRGMADEYKPLAWDSPQMIDHVTSMVAQLAPILGRGRGRPRSATRSIRISTRIRRRSRHTGACSRR